ncbi:MAG TPA: MFS transporter [Firmicutes bacterium]|nr:MFS transporter [Bacillota bacterium]
MTLGWPLIPWLLVAASSFRAAGEPVLLALAGSLTPARQRPAAFSLLYLGNKAGFLAPLAAGMLFRSALTWVFLGYAPAAFLSGALVGVLVPRTSQTAPPAGSLPSAKTAAAPEGVVAVLVRQPALPLVAAALLASLAALAFGRLGREDAAPPSDPGPV